MVKPGAITLESIVQGQRCTPLSAQEFERYLMYKAHAIELLQFHHWYTDYRRRFSELDPHERERAAPPPPGSLLLGREAARPILSPKSLRSFATSSARSEAPLSGRSTPLNPSSPTQPFGAAWQPVESATTAVSSRTLPATFWRRRGSKDVAAAAAPGALDEAVFGEACHPRRGSKDAGEPSGLLWPRRGSKDAGCAPCAPPTIAVTIAIDVAPAPDASFLGLADAPPFAAEIGRIVATFFEQGASSELNIDGVLRQLLLATLAVDARGHATGTTHPDAFGRVDELCWGMLRDSCLPDFLRFASHNINESKTLFWYAVGLCDISVGLLVSLCCLFFVHSRWARLAGFPFLNFGVMQFFSATQHFCTQVYGRDSRQLYPWELADPTLRPPSTEGDAVDAAVDTEKGKDAGLVAPWQAAMELDEVPELPARPTTTLVAGAPLLGLPRVPIFGPEVGVKDEYILSVQKRLITNILVVGMVGMCVLGAALLAVPEM